MMENGQMLYGRLPMLLPRLQEGKVRDFLKPLIACLIEILKAHGSEKNSLFTIVWFPVGG